MQLEKKREKGWFLDGVLKQLWRAAADLQIENSNLMIKKIKCMKFLLLLKCLRILKIEVQL